MTTIAVLDVCTSVDPVRGAGSLKAAQRLATPLFRAFLSAWSNPETCGLQLHSGPHIFTKIRNVLTKAEGWSAEDADTWVELCKQLCLLSGGRIDHETSTLPLKKLTALGGAWGVDLGGLDDDDTNVVRIVKAAKATILFTTEKKFSTVVDQDYEVWKPEDFADEVFASIAAAQRKLVTA